MPTGRSQVSTCAARAALAGNPSDGYGGAVVAVPIHDLTAVATASEAERFTVRAGDPDLRALLEASAAGFADATGALPSVTLSASTAIPRSVGLAGSSALVIAALRVLAASASLRWQPVELAELALAVEVDRLGIAAGLQDRLVQAVGVPVAMTFDPVGYRELTLPDGLGLFVAWTPHGAEPSTVVHRSLRRRFDAGDEPVVAAMRELAVQAGRARRAIEHGDIALLGEAMNRSFDLRAGIVEIDAVQRTLVDVGRAVGAAVNSAGSGGSVVGLVRRPERLDVARDAYARAGFEFLAVE
ncbi:MAG TPA: hypothetical protein VIS05_01970 [Ilumatobacter sp.]